MCSRAAEHAQTRPLGGADRPSCECAACGARRVSFFAVAITCLPPCRPSRELARRCSARPCPCRAPADGRSGCCAAVCPRASLSCTQVNAGALGAALVDGLDARLHVRVQRMDDLMGEAEVEGQVAARRAWRGSRRRRGRARACSPRCTPWTMLRSERPASGPGTARTDARAGLAHGEPFVRLLDLHLGSERALELALGPLDLHRVPPSIGHRARPGDRDGALADARDADRLRSASAITTPRRGSRRPPCCSRAVLSLITPCDVDMIATPRPLCTFGMSR